MADIAKIKLPGSDTIYNVKDNGARQLIKDLPKAMVFKGSVGNTKPEATITWSELPAASSENEGWSYKVISDHTSSAPVCKTGDMIISNASTWVVIPSGDEQGGGTVTSVGAGTGLTTSNDGNPITTSGTISLNSDTLTSLGKADTALQEHQTVTLASGSADGTLKITTGAGTTDNIAVKGLKTAAYTDTTEYATAAQGAKADSALQSHQTVTLAGGTNNGTLKITTAAGTADNISVTGLGTAAFTSSTAYATSAQGSKADSALQASSITSGTASGTIAVNGTNVSVKGLGTAAFTASSAYATSAQGAKADSALQSHQTVTLASGTNNGTLKITTAAGTTDNISVKGLGTAAFTASTAYATSAQGTKADNAIPNPSTKSADQYLKYNGSAWVAASVAAGGGTTIVVSSTDPSATLKTGDFWYQVTG